MIVTVHSMVRYAQRILGIVNEKEAKKYVNENKEELTKIILELKGKSKFLFFGAIGDHEIRNFYLHEDILIVCNEKNESIMSILKLDYGFSEEINKNIIIGLLKDIEKRNNILENIKSNIAVELPKHQSELDIVNNEIKILENQLSIMKKKKEVIEENINTYSKDLEFNNLEKEKLLTKIIYCIAYKMDFLSNGNNNGNKTVA